MKPPSLSKQVYFYLVLMRLNKPIPILLLLWPTLWALWLASQGSPDFTVFFILVTGTILMRSAGCVINDFADRNLDKYVARTRSRPLTSGQIGSIQALSLFALLLCAAFFLVLFCNRLAIQLAFIGAALAIFYPFLKRVTHLPQLGLGFAFSWGVPMAFAAQTSQVTPAAWFVFATGVIWPVIYDTFYAMVDREDDIKIGIKSTAIFFGHHETKITALLQLLFLLMLVVTGWLFHLHSFYYLSLVMVSFLFLYQQWLIKERDKQKCIQAFLNNHWVGLIIFTGIYLSYFQ